MTRIRRLPMTTLGLILFLAAEASAQSMGPHKGPICPDPGPVHLAPTPVCGAAALGFRPGRFRTFYAGPNCAPREVFLGCLAG